MYVQIGMCKHSKKKKKTPLSPLSITSCYIVCKNYWIITLLNITYMAVKKISMIDQWSDRLLLLFFFTSNFSLSRFVKWFRFLFPSNKNKLRLLVLVNSLFFFFVSNVGHNLLSRTWKRVGSGIHPHSFLHGYNSLHISFE